MYEREPATTAVIGENTFDVSNISGGGSIPYNLNWETKSIVLDFMDDAQGNPATGKLAIFIGGNTGGAPWAIVKAGDLLVRLIGSGDLGTDIKVVAIAGGCTGLLHIQLCREALAPGRYH